MLEKVLPRAISKKQILILNEVYSGDYKTKTGAIWKISRKLNIPESTVRWNVNRLLSGGIIENNGMLKASVVGAALLKISGEVNGK